MCWWSWSTDDQLRWAVNLQKGPSILSPVLSVEINRQEMTTLVLKHGIDADDEVAPTVIDSGQVPPNNLVRYREKATIGTVRALNPGLLTDAPHPFVCASWLVARPPSLPAFKTNRINLLSPAK
jgi:hypothetical protein